MILLLLLIPTIAGVLAIFIPADLPRRLLLIGAAAAHSAVVATVWVNRPEPELGGWLAIDAAGLVFLTITSSLFLASSIYCVGYLARERRTGHVDFVDSLYFTNEAETVFTGCLLLFLASMTLVITSQHFGLLWVGVEATTLASAPLIYFHRQHRSLEATWKYLLICSVGIALALLGNFVLAIAVHGSGEGGTSMLLGDLLSAASRGDVDVRWLQAAFLFFLVGYGTKMGLAPMHTWLPDAHSESPSVVSALLSGALLNCAFLGILRAHQVCVAAGVAHFSQNLLLIFGLISMGVAAVFILGQVDFKRMLAYSSVEHMGIMALGIGLGGAGAFGAGLHAVNHSLTKAALFLVAGNILSAYGTKAVRDIRGVLRVIPISGVLWVGGFLAITGSPPFGPFLSEFTVLKAALDGERNVVAILYLAILGVIFIGMANIVLHMAQGEPSPAAKETRGPERLLAVLPPACLGLLVLVGGLYVPPSVSGVLHELALAMGGH